MIGAPAPPGESSTSVASASRRSNWSRAGRPRSLDALHAEWRAAAVAGQLIEPTDTDYGMREGARVDPDGNRIRFGCPLHD